MVKNFLFLYSIILFQFTSACYADDMLVDANLMFVIPDAGGSDNFNVGKIFTVNYNYYSYPWLALTVGAFASDQLIDKPKIDIVGTYQSFIDTYGFTLGLRPEHLFSKRNKIYARVGILFYNTTVSVDEYFEYGLPTGTSSSDTSGNGYFISAAWAHTFGNNISFQLELSRQKQLKLFDGKAAADQVFDLGLTGIGFGLAYAF